MLQLSNHPGLSSQTTVWTRCHPDVHLILISSSNLTEVQPQWYLSATIFKAHQSYHAGPIRIQSPLSLHRGVSVFSVTSLELTYHKIISVPSEQLSTVSHGTGSIQQVDLASYRWTRQTGSAQEVDLDGPGSVPLNSTSNHTTWASTRRGSGHSTFQDGVNLWERLCSLKGMPPDDDDDDDDDDESHHIL